MLIHSDNYTKLMFIIILFYETYQNVLKVESNRIRESVFHVYNDEILKISQIIIVNYSNNKDETVVLESGKTS